MNNDEILTYLSENEINDCLSLSTSDLNVSIEVRTRYLAEGLINDNYFIAYKSNRMEFAIINNQNDELQVFAHQLFWDLGAHYFDVNQSVTPADSFSELTIELLCLETWSFGKEDIRRKVRKFLEQCYRKAIIEEADYYCSEGAKS